MTGSEKHIYENAILLEHFTGVLGEDDISGDMQCSGLLSNEQLSRIRALDGLVDGHRECARWALAGLTEA